MMYATNKLRFVERQARLHPMYKKMNERGELVNATQSIKVLQQWWEDRNTQVHWLDGNPGEWRDVPTGEE
jgi:hypothetical protein